MVKRIRKKNTKNCTYPRAFKTYDDSYFFDIICNI